MDVESPKHLERLRDQPEFKAALLRFQPKPMATEARFERAAKNTMYWPPIETLSARFLATGRSEEIRETHHVYGRPCWLLAITLAQSPDAPYTIAVAAADGAPVEVLVALLQDVSDDYWHGSYFFNEAFQWLLEVEARAHSSLPCIHELVKASPVQPARMPNCIWSGRAKARRSI